MVWSPRRVYGISTEVQQGISGRDIYLYWTCATNIWSQRVCCLVWAELGLCFEQYSLKNSEMTNVSNNHINIIPVSILFMHKNASIYVLYMYIYICLDRLYIIIWTTFWTGAILVLFQWKLCNIYEESGFFNIQLPKYLLHTFTRPSGTWNKAYKAPDLHSNQKLILLSPECSFVELSHFS